MSLKNIALNMKSAAQARGRSSTTLERGLQMKLTYTRANRTYRLTLSREDGSPSEVEVGICRRAFDVPRDSLTTVDFAEEPAVHVTWQQRQAELPAA